MRGGICCVTMAKVTNDITLRSTDIPEGRNKEEEDETALMLSSCVCVCVSMHSVIFNYWQQKGSLLTQWWGWWLHGRLKNEQFFARRPVGVYVCLCAAPLTLKVS